MSKGRIRLAARCAAVLAGMVLAVPVELAQAGGDGATVGDEGRAPAESPTDGTPDSGTGVGDSTGQGVTFTPVRGGVEVVGDVRGDCKELAVEYVTLDGKGGVVFTGDAAGASSLGTIQLRGLLTVREGGGDALGGDVPAGDLLVGCGPEDPEEFPYSPPKKQRVAVQLGDSYAAGVGGGDFLGTDPGINAPVSHPFFCGRSANSMIAVAAASIGLAPRNIACGGARSENILSPETFHENAAQLEQLRSIALAEDVELIVVTIGGNDTFWTDAVSQCHMNFMLDAAMSYSTILGFFAGDTSELDPCTLYPESMADGVAGRVATAVMTVTAMMDSLTDTDGNRLYPDGMGVSYRVVVTSYPSFFPATPAARFHDENGKDDGDPTFWDLAEERYGFGCAVHESSFAPLSEGADLLSSELRAASYAAGAEFLDLSRSFDGHRLCEDSVRSDDWMNPLHVGELANTPGIQFPFGRDISTLAKVKRLRDDLREDPAAVLSVTPSDSWLANAIKSLLNFNFSGASLHPTKDGYATMGACLANAWDEGVAPDHGCANGADDTLSFTPPGGTPRTLDPSEFERVIEYSGTFTPGYYVGTDWTSITPLPGTIDPIPFLVPPAGNNFYSSGPVVYAGETTCRVKYRGELGTSAGAMEGFTTGMSCYGDRAGWTVEWAQLRHEFRFTDPATGVNVFARVTLNYTLPTLRYSVGYTGTPHALNLPPTSGATAPSPIPTDLTPWDRNDAAFAPNTTAWSALPALAWDQPGSDCRFTRMDAGHQGEINFYHPSGSAFAVTCPEASMQVSGNTFILYYDTSVGGQATQVIVFGVWAPCARPVSWWDGSSVVPTFDSVNCHVRSVPQGETGFVSGGRYFITANNNCPTGYPVNGSGTGCLAATFSSTPLQFYVVMAQGDDAILTMIPLPGIPLSQIECPTGTTFFSNDGGAKRCKVTLPPGYPPTKVFTAASTGGLVEVLLPVTITCDDGLPQGNRCLMGTAPAGVTPFVYEGAFYYAP